MFVIFRTGPCTTLAELVLVLATLATSYRLLSRQVKGDKSGVEMANVKMSMNPFCEIAVEQVLLLPVQSLTPLAATISLLLTLRKLCVERCSGSKMLSKR